MSVTEITPYLGVFAPVAGGIAVLDFLFKEDIKKRVYDSIACLARLGQRPLSKRFYFFSLAVSIICTCIIVVASGAFQSLVDRHESFLIAAKSSAPLLLAIVLKILFWDYALAVKSALLTGAFRRLVSFLPPDKRPGRFRLVIGIGLLVVWDLCLSALLTAGFLYYAQHYQALHIDPAVQSSPVIPTSLKAVFDEISFAAKEAIENAFYILNGALVFYCSFGVARLCDHLKGKVDEAQLQKNIFKIIAAFGSVVVLVVVVSCRLAYR